MHNSCEWNSIDTQDLLHCARSWVAEKKIEEEYWSWKWTRQCAFTPKNSKSLRCEIEYLIENVSIRAEKTILVFLFHFNICNAGFFSISAPTLLAAVKFSVNTMKWILHFFTTGNATVGILKWRCVSSMPHEASNKLHSRLNRSLIPPLHPFVPSYWFDLVAIRSIAGALARCIVQNKYYHLHFVISYPFRGICFTHNFLQYWIFIKCFSELK